MPKRVYRMMKIGESNVRGVKGRIFQVSKGVPQQRVVSCTQKGEEATGQ